MCSSLAQFDHFILVVVYYFIFFLPLINFCCLFLTTSKKFLVKPFLLASKLTQNKISRDGEIITKYDNNVINNMLQNNAIRFDDVYNSRHLVRG